MTEFRYSFPLAALLLLNCSSAQAEISCTASPDCASLGYSQTAAECSGKAAIKCPFDINKMYCKKTPVIEGCTVGSFVYTDKSCSGTYDKTRTLVGVVFDPVKKLAVMSGFIIPSMLNQLTYNSDLEFCSPAAAFTACGTDGKTNTRNIFRKQPLQHPSGNVIFGTSLCTAQNIVCFSDNASTSKPISSTLWYGINHWFIPSLKELDQIYQNLTAINNSFSKLNINYLIPQTIYPSSTFNDNLHIFVYDFTSGEKQIKKSANIGSINVLPIINYGNTSPVLNCTAEGTADYHQIQNKLFRDSEGCYLKTPTCKLTTTAENIHQLKNTCPYGYRICSSSSSQTINFACCTPIDMNCSK